MHSRTSYRWCWWLRNAALSMRCIANSKARWKADDLYHTAGTKGQAQGGGKKSLGRRARGRRKKREPGRGHYDKDRPAIIAWVSRQGAVVIQATRDFTVKTVQKAADLAGTQAVALHGLRQQLSGTQGLCARVRQSHTERVRTWGCTREPGGVPVFLAQAVPAGVSWPQ